MKKLLSITAILFGAILAFAQSPEKMSYQAIVRNASGQILQNQNVAVKASILQGSSSGTVVYSERITGTTNANGSLALEIGGGTVLSGTFSSINWSSGNYWLKTETDPNGGTNYTIAGTSQLLSVPYAMYAKSSGGSLTLPYSGDSNSSSTTFSITNQSGANGAVAINGWGTGSGIGVRGMSSGNSGVNGSSNSGYGVEALSNTGVAGYFSSNSGLALKTGTGGTEINGNLKIASGTPGAGKVLTSDASGNATWQTPTGGGSSQWTTNGNNIYNSNTGGVGIGADPGSGTKLNVTTSNSTYGLFVDNTNGLGTAIRTNAVNERAIWAVSQGSSYGTIYANNTGGGPAITTAGRIGVNNTNPAYTLDVAGRMRLRNESASATAGLWLDGPTSAARSFIGTFTQNLMGIYGISSGWSFLHDVTTGNTGIGIGENTPNSKLQVGGSVSMPFKEVSDNYTATDDDYTIRFVASSNMNVSKTITLPAAAGRAGRIYKIFASIHLSGPATAGNYTPTTLKVMEAGTNINVIEQETSYTFATYEKAMQNTIAQYSNYNDQLHLTSITVQSNGASWKIIEDNFSFTKNTF
ncbi:MAG: hypothetical protein QM564_13165 [Bergeyella sp.]